MTKRRFRPNSDLPWYGCTSASPAAECLSSAIEMQFGMGRSARGADLWLSRLAADPRNVASTHVWIGGAAPFGPDDIQLWPEPLTSPRVLSAKRFKKPTDFDLFLAASQGYLPFLVV